MKPWLIGLCLGASIGLALHPAPVVAWTEHDLQAAERILDWKIAEAKAKAEAEAEVKAKAEAKAKADAEAKAKAEVEAKARVEAERARALEGIAQGMVKIPAGKFQMGCSPGDGVCDNDEKSPHAVQVRAFRMGKYEITQAQWRAITGENPSRFKGDERPVDNVSWEDVQGFLKRLNAGDTVKPYRLPTEAEWEYAARGGSKDAYWWGKDVGRGQATCDGCGSQWDKKETAPVGSFKANPFGLYDTVGNVWEWVADCWHGDYKGAPADGFDWHANCLSAGRGLRGGSWDNPPWLARVSNRNWHEPAWRNANNGLRLAQGL